MKRILGVALILMCVGLVPAQAEMVSRIAAVVNDQIITTRQLDQALKLQLAKLETRPSPAQVGALRTQMLSRLIEEELVQQRIRSLNLTVTEAEVETAILDVQKQNQLSRDELEQAVLIQGLTMEQYEDNLRKQILRYKLLGQEVRSKVDVAEREVLEYFRNHLDEYRSAPQVGLTVLSFPVPERAGAIEKDKIRQAARAAMGKVREGASLESVAAEYTETFGATATPLEPVEYEALSPDYVSAIEGVATGQLGTLVESPAAIQLLRVDQRNEGGLRQFDAVKVEIYQMLMDQKTDARMKDWIQSLKQRSFIDIRL